MSDQHPPYGDQPRDDRSDNPYGNQYGGQSGDQYGSQPYGSPSDGARPGKGMAIAALIIGILALLFSWTVVVGIAGGLLALVLGLVASSRAKKGRAGGRGMALTGAVLGVLGLLVGIGIIVAAVAFVNSDSAQDLQDCLDRAGSDQAAVDQCGRDFADQLGG